MWGKLLFIFSFVKVSNQQKEMPKNAREAQVIRMQRKKEEQLNYKQKFAEYISEKRSSSFSRFPYLLN